MTIRTQVLEVFFCIIGVISVNMINIDLAFMLCHEPAFFTN